MFLKPSSANLQSFDQVPDKIPVIPAGIYCIQITEVKFDQITANKGKAEEKKSNVMQLSYQVDSGLNGAETPQKGRKGQHTVFLDADNQTQQESRDVRLKNLFQSCGLTATAEGFDSNQLKGAKCNVEIKNTIDKGTEYANISKFLKVDGSQF